MVLALVAAIPALASVAAGTVIIPAGVVIPEDLYATGPAVIVEGTIRGDLVVATRRLEIRGVVEGDVTGLAWNARIDGRVEGSVRLAAWSVDQGGDIGDDLLAVGRRVRLDGSIGRDVLAAGWSVEEGGRVGRDLRAEVLWGFTLSGRVERQVEVGAHRVRVEPGATVGDDLSYRPGLLAQLVPGWGPRTNVSPDAVVGGRVIAKQNGVIQPSARPTLLFLRVMAFLSFLLTGIVLLGAFPAAGERATAALATWRSPLIGLGLVVGVPAAVAVAAVSLILLPPALPLAAMWMFALFAAPVPVAAAAGALVVRGRAGGPAAFALGAILLQLLLLVPLAGLLLYGAVTVWGLGAWGLALWRRGRMVPAPSTAA